MEMRPTISWEARNHFNKTSTVWGQLAGETARIWTWDTVPWKIPWFLIMSSCHHVIIFCHITFSDICHDVMMINHLEVIPCHTMSYHIFWHTHTQWYHTLCQSQMKWYSVTRQTVGDPMGPPIFVSTFFGCVCRRPKKKVGSPSFSPWTWQFYGIPMYSPVFRPTPRK